MSQLLPSTIPDREFEYHTDGIRSVAVLPDKRRMVTGSNDKTLCLWDLSTGVVLKKMEGHCDRVRALALSRDGELIASSDESGELIAWHGKTGESLTQPIKAHSNYILSLDFSPDGTVLASGSFDGMTKLWCTKTWRLQGTPIQCGDNVRCIRYSPSGALLAIATHRAIEIYNPDKKERVANFKGHVQWNCSLAWLPDGTRLLSGGHGYDPTIREWDTSTWQQVGDPWMGHTQDINAIAIHPSGTLVASASEDSSIHLWQLSDRLAIAIFEHSSMTRCVTFSMDGKHILSGGYDKLISEWAVPKDVLPVEVLKKSAPKARASELDLKPQILAMNTTARNACIAGDLSTAEALFTQEIDTNANNYTSYGNRSFVMARKNNWDQALDDAVKSVTIQPSLIGYISKGIALCGKGQVRDSIKAFDLAFMFADDDSRIIHFLLLIKAITMFNGDQHEEAIIRVQELAEACPNNDTLACRVVEAYLRVRLGINAMDDACHNEAVDHFITAVNSIAFSSTLAIHSLYEDLVVLFGWDLKSLWQNAHQKRCDALLRAGRLEEAFKSYRHMMDLSDETTMSSCLDWSNAFKQECSMLYLANGNSALAASDYDRAIDLYSMAIDLNSTTDIIFENRSKAELERMLWEDALFDAQKVIELNPSSHVGYQLKYSALHGAQRYDEAIAAFQIMLLKLSSAADAQIRKLRQQYVTPSKATSVIRMTIDDQLDTAPLHLLNTATGLLCNREAQIKAFEMSTEYKELLLSTMTHPDLRTEQITEVVATYFRCVMLSHRWEENEPSLQDVRNKIVFKLNSLGGIVKLQKFCEIARDAGYRWAWSDTCCIDKSNNVELQQSLTSMFVWYRHSALTIVYLSDVPPSSKSGALAKSEWNKRGWTFQEFVAPKVVLFYQMDWTPYLDDHSPNHKESAAIMEELEGATGIDQQALVAFLPGMRGIRERLQWASTRVTTLQEDIAYSLFGIFNVQLPLHYGEKKQSALGRLLQDIVARSGDITALDWVGQSSDFNSCLPADISSYAAPPCALPSLSEDEVQIVRNVVSARSALMIYTQLDDMSAPRFANCRLHLPCISFRVTEVIRKRGPAQETHVTYGVKADGLHDLQITTEEKLVQFSRARPTRRTFLLVRPRDRHLLGLADFADDSESLGEWSEPASPVDDSSVEQEQVDSESSKQALRLLVRLGQPFSAFLLAQQRGGEYRRIASDHDIIAQVKDIASIHNIMEIRTLEIL